jgi:hypothetical protein
MAQEAYQGNLLAEETHTGRMWSLAILPVIIGPAISVALYPRTPAMYGLVAVLVIGFGVLAMIWSGFRYRFRHEGVEISMLGIRLRSIPRRAIVRYSIEPWGFPRGYGIRGIGRSRAYTWGNKVVRIQTTDGEVYLGHEDPQRIIRDLNQVTGLSMGN